MMFLMMMFLVVDHYILVYDNVFVTVFDGVIVYIVDDDDVFYDNVFDVVIVYVVDGVAHWLYTHQIQH